MSRAYEEYRIDGWAEAQAHEREAMEAELAFINQQLFDEMCDDEHYYEEWLKDHPYEYEESREMGEMPMS